MPRALVEVPKKFFGLVLLFAICFYIIASFFFFFWVVS